MDLDWNNEERDLYDGVVTFCKESLQHDVGALDANSEFPKEAWQSCADFGVLGWRVPAELGGKDYPASLVAFLMEAFGYGCEDNGLAFALGTQLWGVQTALLQFGNEEQLEKYVPGMLRGELIGAHAMNEDSSGSDAFAIETTAVADGDDFLLNGEKTLVTFAPNADFAIVFAKTAPDAGQWGISTFLVDADTPGYTASEPDEMMGLRTAPYGRVLLEDCRVPSSSMLGKTGAGASIFGFIQSWERSLVLAPHVGAMQRLLEQSLAFARERKRGGAPIGKHQAIAHRIADMKLRLETARLLLYDTVRKQQDGAADMMGSALSKIYLSECLTQTALDAVAIHGGDGYLTEAGIERNLRDAIGATIYSGTTDVQRNIIARLLGL
ncbi:MAG: acyl-CoA dehydrogenase family protein [Woeseiaceae bacterium]|nr:acyl-CoA dehydrogenase family protein [Woeseiaceae bacterium]